MMDGIEFVSAMKDDTKVSFTVVKTAGSAQYVMRIPIDDLNGGAATADKICVAVTAKSYTIEKCADENSIDLIVSLALGCARVDYRITCYKDNSIATLASVSTPSVPTIVEQIMDLEHTHERLTPTQYDFVKAILTRQSRGIMTVIPARDAARVWYARKMAPFPVTIPMTISIPSVVYVFDLCSARDDLAQILPAINCVRLILNITHHAIFIGQLTVHPNVKEIVIRLCPEDNAQFHAKGRDTIADLARTLSSPSRKVTILRSETDAKVELDINDPLSYNPSSIDVNLTIAENTIRDLIPQQDAPVIAEQSYIPTLETGEFDIQEMLRDQLISKVTLGTPNPYGNQECGPCVR